MSLRPLDEWIADLRAHRDELAAELKRVDEALSALGAGPKLVPPAPVSMIDMIVALFEDNPNETYDADEINSWLEKNGVPRDDAKDPVNSVRGALSRLKHRGVIKNVRRGVFQLNTPPGEEPDEPSRHRAPVEDRTPQSDPWSTPQAKDPWAPAQAPAPAPASAPAGDEPPF